MSLNTIRTIGIIGYGHFGAFLHARIQEHAPSCTVKIYSSKHAAGNAPWASLADVCACDIVIPCVPIAAFEETIHRIQSLLGTQTIVCDVATVKVHPVHVLRTAGIPRFIATHPMFGPESFSKRASSLTGLTMVVSDTTFSQAELEECTRMLASVGLVVLKMDAQTHDMYLARSLFLTHLVGQSIVAAHITRTPIDTISFGFLMDAVESVAPDTALFTDVYRYNPYCKDMMEEFANALSLVSQRLHAHTLALANAGDVGV